MAAIINDRDITLQATTPRLEEVGSNKIILIPSATNFVKTAGGIQPSSITIKPVLTGILNNLSSLTWSVSPTVTYSEAGDKVITINSSAVTIGTPVVFTATLAFLGITYTTSITLNSLQETIVSTLSKNSVSISTASDGSGGDYTAATSTMTILVGNTDDSSNWTYSWSVPATVTATGGATRTISVSAISVTTPVTLTCTATKTGYTTQTKDFVVTKSLAGVAGSNAQLLSLDPTDWAFIFESSTATAATHPASITFTANKQNITGTTSFTAIAYNSSNVSLGNVTLTGTGDTRTLTAANFNSLGTTTVRYVKVSATLGSLTDTVTIWRGDNGSDALTFLLTNEAHVLPAASDGIVSSYTGAVTYAAVFRGITNETSLWTFSKSDGTGLTTTLTGSGTANITVTATALASGTDAAVCTITATRTGYPTLTKDFSLSKSKAGTNGSPGAKGDKGDTGEPGTPGSTGLEGIRSITAYRVRSQSDAALTTAPSNTSGATAPTNYSLTAPTATVGQVVWYSFGRYNPNGTTVESIPANTTVWSVPIAASVFQDIKSDNWTGGTPTGGSFTSTTGYYLNKTEGSLYATSAYLRGTLTSGTSGNQRIEINNSSSNKVVIYNASNQQLASFGGTGTETDGILRITPQYIREGVSNQILRFYGIEAGVPEIYTTATRPSGVISQYAYHYFGRLTRSGSVWLSTFLDYYNGFPGSGDFFCAGVASSISANSNTYSSWPDGTGYSGLLGFRDEYRGFRAGGFFTTDGDALSVTLADSAGYAVNVRSGQIKYGSVAIGVPPNNATQVLVGNGTWTDSPQLANPAASGYYGLSGGVSRKILDYDNAAMAAIVGREITNGGFVVTSNAIRPLQLRGTAVTDLGTTSGGDYTFRNFGWGGYLISPPPGGTGSFLRSDGTWAAASGGGGGTVTSVAVSAGTGISISGSPITTSGTITVTNSGVTSAAGGTGVSVSASTGAVTFSIGQSVGTGSSVQFGSLGVGTGATGTNGEIVATNNITAYYSDDRLKTNLGIIENALDKLCSLSGFYYQANELAQSLGYTPHREVGLSAQQVELVLPEIVAPAPIDNKYKTLRYERLAPLIVEAIKELRADLNTIKSIIIGLQNDSGKQWYTQYGRQYG